MSKTKEGSASVTSLPVTGLALMRVAFLPNQISKLAKESKSQAEEHKKDRSVGVNCPVCGAWHHKKAVHLDYVGHAALTDRLLDCDPEWNWEPVKKDADGAPVLDGNNGMWIRLTVCGVTRLGYGFAAPNGMKEPGDLIKEIIGDALRNAAMRFGAALDLWHKGDLHAPSVAVEEGAGAEDNLLIVPHKPIYPQPAPSSTKQAAPATSVLLEKALARIKAPGTDLAQAETWVNEVFQGNDLEVAKAAIQDAKNDRASDAAEADKDVQF